MCSVYCACCASLSLQITNAFLTAEIFACLPFQPVLENVIFAAEPGRREMRVRGAEKSGKERMCERKKDKYCLFMDRFLTTQSLTLKASDCRTVWFEEKAGGEQRERNERKEKWTTNERRNGVKSTETEEKRMKRLKKKQQKIHHDDNDDQKEEGADGDESSS